MLLASKAQYFMNLAFPAMNQNMFKSALIQPLFHQLENLKFIYPDLPYKMLKTTQYSFKPNYPC